MFLQVDYNCFSYTWILEYIFYQKNIFLCASWWNICFLPDEYTSLCKLMKMVMNSTSNLHVSSLGGVMRNYKMSSLHGSTSSQKSSWRAWECIQQGRKTIVQDLVVSWNTLVSCTVVFQSCCVHSQACQLDFRRFVLKWKEDGYVEVPHHSTPELLSVSYRYVKTWGNIHELSSRLETKLLQFLTKYSFQTSIANSYVQASARVQLSI